MTANWIKTSEQLPPKDCYVLGYVTKSIELGVDVWEDIFDERYFAILKLTDAEEYPFHAITFDCDIEDVLFWTHLPEPPKE